MFTKKKKKKKKKSRRRKTLDQVLPSINPLALSNKKYIRRPREQFHRFPGASKSENRSASFFSAMSPRSIQTIGVSKIGERVYVRSVEAVGRKETRSNYVFSLIRPAVKCRTRPGYWGRKFLGAKPGPRLTMGIFISRGPRRPNGRTFDSVFIGSSDIPGARARALDRKNGRPRLLDRDIERSSI